MSRLPSSRVTLLVVAICALVLHSCAKPAANAPVPSSAAEAVPTPSVTESSAPTDTKPAITTPETQVETPTEAMATAALPMKPVAAEPAPKPVKTSPASSLGGQDRHLAQRPFDTIPAMDFELGPLSSKPSPAELSNALDTLAAALRQGSLPLDIFESGMATVARLLYVEALSIGPHIYEVRFQEPASGPGGAVSIGLRLMATIENEDRTARGLAIMTEQDAKVWRIEHLELDLGALEMASPDDRGVYDPYTRSFSGNQGD